MSDVISFCDREMRSLLPSMVKMLTSVYYQSWAVILAANLPLALIFYTYRVWDIIGLWSRLIPSSNGLCVSFGSIRDKSRNRIISACPLASMYRIRPFSGTRLITSFIWRVDSCENKNHISNWSRQKVSLRQINNFTVSGKMNASDDITVMNIWHIWQHKLTMMAPGIWDNNSKVQYPNTCCG